MRCFIPHCSSFHRVYLPPGREFVMHGLEADEVDKVDAHSSAEIARGNLESPSQDEGESLREKVAILPSVKEIAMLIARFACNNHTICDEELRPVRNFLVTSKINHVYCSQCDHMHSGPHHCCYLLVTYITSSPL